MMILVYGARSNVEILYHINVSELLAIELALKAFLKDSNKNHVRIFLDNTTAVTYKVVEAVVQRCSVKKVFFEIS